MRTQHNIYLKKLNKRVLIFDGAMGTSLQALHLTAENFGGESFHGCNDHLNLTDPASVSKVHNSFLDVGVDVIETNTFRSNRITLAEFGLADKADRINRMGAQIARKAADAFSTLGHQRFVAGAMGPSGKILSLRTDGNSDQALSFDDIREVYCQQAAGLIAGGVDLLLIETAQDILEVKAAILGIHDAFNKTNTLLPIQAQVTLNTNGTMLTGTDIQSVLVILEGMAIDIIGINCSTGPAEMEPAIKYLSTHTHLPISCLPNAGLPINRNGEAFYPLTPAEFAIEMTAFVEKYHVSTVGGCCGTTPEHLSSLVKMIGSNPQVKREIIQEPSLSSAYHTLQIKQEPPPFIVGERLNTQGSRAFKELMLANNFTGALEIAKLQANGGAHALDLCTALTEDDDEAHRMAELTRLISEQIDLPLVIDSTNVGVMEAALKVAPGRCLLNSINLENGEEKAEQVLALAKKFNAGVIALTIDENGMAKTVARKLAVAKRIYHLAVDTCQVAPHAIVFDPLTFTLASGSSETVKAGIETLNAIQQIKKELPGVFTILGISNISYGLSGAARRTLNSVFLYYALQAGLDLAILNPAQIAPYTAIPDAKKRAAEDLIFNRGDHALAAFIALSETSGQTSKQKLNVFEESLPIEEKIRRHILVRERKNLETDLDTYMYEGSSIPKNEKALTLLNDILLPVMQEVGDQFARGELILPFVLQSAEIMRTSTNHLDQYLDKNKGHSKGTLVLATVYGDVHDIGKDLVKTIISNNGYSVIDLGKQVPAEMIIQKAHELKADAIGLSALLVSTSQQMPYITNMLHARHSKIPVLIGGAAVNAAFADRIKITETGEPYGGGVHYCKDAFDALKVLGQINRGIKSAETLMPSEDDHKVARSKLSITLPVFDNKIPPSKIPAPPFFGAKKFSLPLVELIKHIRPNVLFRLNWGAKNASGAQWEKYEKDFETRLESMLTHMKKTRWLTPHASYGYWQCSSSGNSLQIFPEEDALIDLPIQLNFPRQKQEPYLCLSDFFASTKSSKKDIVAFQLVSMGSQAVEYVHTLHEGGDLVESYFAHGLAVHLTEAAAVFIHNRIRSELNIDQKQGKRYSWGYSPIPDLSQHAHIVRLLQAEENLGIALTSGYQFVPEYSTAAMIVHHPDAVYFQIEKKG